jgi:hypothetical protein
LISAFLSLANSFSWFLVCVIRVDNAESKVENEQINQKKHSTEIGDIETKIRQSKSSLYGWLNDNVPNWEGTIGKV